MDDKQQSEYEEEISQLKKYVLKWRSEVERLEIVEKRNEQLEKEIDDIKIDLGGVQRKKSNDEENGEKSGEPKSLEEEVVYLKFELVKAQEREDWHAIQMREMAEQYSQLSTEQEEMIMYQQQAAWEQEQTKDCRRKSLRNFAGESFRVAGSSIRNVGESIRGDQTKSVILSLI